MCSAAARAAASLFDCFWKGTENTPGTSRAPALFSARALKEKEREKRGRKKEVEEKKKKKKGETEGGGGSCHLEKLARQKELNVTVCSRLLTPVPLLGPHGDNALYSLSASAVSRPGCSSLFLST